jgi:FAD/FMN-containing dehydrogenase
MNFETEENKIKNIKIIKDASHEIYSLVKNYKGSITAEHNDGLIRTPFLNYMYDEEMLSLFKKVKAIFDPNNIFNPGKKVPLIEDVDIEFNRNISFLRKF